ncbi:MAG TPA: DNA integrity scanning diadenylate cyclase DisA [Actinomycetaceae bacterium]|nr:DNA integrity scanning diadenylate cyclase DisA [Actinomycetaceae bacterium]
MPTPKIRSTLAAVAPGTELRDGLERILRARTGAIVVLARGPEVEDLCSGGFELDVEFSPSRLRELAKMDGAVIVDPDLGRIRRANVQLMPDPAVVTAETGMRHRTAQRLSLQVGVPVISVSKSMHTIALYVDGERHVLESAEILLAKANQAISTLERYKTRVNEMLTNLTALEIEDLVTMRDVVQVIQRIEMVVRIWDEIDSYVIQLGTEGRLVQLQLVELVTGIAQNRDLVLEDYTSSESGETIARLAALDPKRLANPTEVARALRLPVGQQGLDTPLSPRGHRMLAQVPRLPRWIASAIVKHMGSLQGLLGSTTEELQHVEGVGPLRARSVRESLSRLAETLIIEQRF